MRGDRQYHSSTLLLQDRRVLSGGGGFCGDCYAAAYEERNAEIFKPSYLYAGDASLAARQALTSVPEAADYGKTVQVSTNVGATITRAHLIKLGSATHSENQDQRIVPLSFIQSGTAITVPVPSSGNKTPPGHYLLFLVDNQGVPSIGGMLKVGQPLIELDDRVVSTLEEGAVDSYAINLQPGQWITDLTPIGAVNLYVSQGARLTKDSLNSAQCQTNPAGQTTQQCSVAISEAQAGQWYVSIAGAARTDYQFDMHIEALPEGTPPITSAGSDRRVTTDGSVSAFWICVFMPFVLTQCLRRYRPYSV